MSYFREQDIIQLCVERLAVIYGSSVLLTGSRSVGGGCINHAVKISTSVGDFFLKWNASAPVDVFLKEAAGLNEMSLAGSSLVIPKVIWSKAVDDFPGLLLMEYLQPASNISGLDERLGEESPSFTGKRPLHLAFTIRITVELLFRIISGRTVGLSFMRNAVFGH